MSDIYNSARDTQLHKENVVNVMMLLILPDLYNRADTHDNSKLQSPEKEVYDEFVPKLRTAKYGTPEYEAIRDEMNQKGGWHHTHVNRHHPEFFKSGISGMTLNDFVEMVCDWFAASLRSDTSFIDGLDRNIKKYDIPPMMASIIKNTYYQSFQKFEEFMKTEDMDKVNKFGNDYKLLAYENCQRGLYSTETRDWLLSNLYMIIHNKEIGKKP